MKKALVLILVLAFVMAAAGCAAPPAGEIESVLPSTEPEKFIAVSTDKYEVSFPRLCLATPYGDMSYYIALEPELAADVAAERAESTPFPELSLEVPAGRHMRQLANLNISIQPDEESELMLMENQILENYGGEYGFSDAKTPESAARLVKLVEETFGWDYSVCMDDFKDLTEIEIMLGGELKETVTNQAVLSKFHDFLKEDVYPMTAPKTDYCCVELRCKKADGSTVSIFADVGNGALWLPPTRWFMIGVPDVNDEEQLLKDALGLSKWPEGVNMDGAYSDEIREKISARVEELVPDPMFVVKR